MNVKEAINKRRAYRSLDTVEISDEIIEQLAKSAQLAPSCFNNQPWNFIFIRNKEQLKKIHSTLTKSNKWVESASLIIAVFTKEESDCIIKERTYYLFDSGIASGFIMLQATELGLVAHPIAGFNEEAVKRILNIPSEMTLITLINVGKHSKELKKTLTDSQKARENQRPQRKKLEKFVFVDSYKNKEIFRI